MERSTLKEFELCNFPTHIAYTKSKSPKYVKINYQNIYNGQINRFSRALMIVNLHNYIQDNIPEGSPIGKNLDEEIEIFTVVNHGSISRKSKEGGQIYWHPPVEDYIPNWDIENLASIWSKVINDTLVTLHYLENDTIQYIKSVKYKFIPVEDLSQRKIVIKFYKNE